jgi:nitrate reductase gamma subunit
MKISLSFIAVLILFCLAYFGAEAGLRWVFGIVVPYAAVGIFFIGLIYRINKWASIPVPFRVPTSCGQQKSLAWISHNRFDNPFTAGAVVVRMVLEILFFRSLFRNTKTEFIQGPRLVYGSSKWLWVGAIAFHYSFFVILVRHLRFFTEPVPRVVTFIHRIDGFFQVGSPVFYVSSVFFVAALVYLFLRRVVSRELRYISLLNDYFPLWLLLGIGSSGLVLRHVYQTDIIAVKELILGLITGKPVVSDMMSSLFFGHFFLACALFAYLPFSKLMHMAGVILSPTRNMANNSRAVRHINPWNASVETRTYQEYEDEFKDKMVRAGIPLDKQ